MEPIRPPYRPNALINATVRTVAGVQYASPHQDASESMKTPAVVWSSFDATTKESYQQNLASTYQVSFHVADETFTGAEVIAGQVWAALRNAPSLDTSLVDVDNKIIAVHGSDLPVENRTPGQLLDFHEFQFTLYIVVGRSH